MIKNELFEHMIRGKQSAHIIRSLLSQRPILNLEKNDQDMYKLLDHHSLVVLDSFDKSLSMLTTLDHVEGEFTRKRKINHVKHCKPEEYGVDTKRSYIRSKSEGSRVEEVTHVTDDGFGWRKYGQKDIRDSIHPRHYYRCTHKYEQDCQATKQVQQISEMPPKYKITYRGNHTCNNAFNASLIQIDQFEENSTSILLNFESKDTIPKNPLNNNPSLMFPTSAFHAIAQDCSSFKEDIPSILDTSYKFTNHCSSSSDDFSSFEGQTTISEQLSTPSSEQASIDISLPENCSLIVSPNNYLEEDYVLSCIMANFYEGLQDV